MKFLSNNSIWIIVFIIFILMFFASENFYTLNNQLNVLRQVSILGIICIGIAIVLIGGNFDLSIGAIITACAVTSLAMQPTSPGLTLLSIIIPITVGLLCGLINGILVGYLNLNSIVATIGTQFTFTGFLLYSVSGQHVYAFDTHAIYFFISNGRLFGIPFPVYLLFSFYILAFIILKFSLFGRYLEAVGGNIRSAYLSGINTKKIIVYSYLISGLMSSLGGILIASRVRNMDPTAGIGYEFLALTAVILGGTKLTGGYGRIFNVFAGVLIIGLISNSITLLNLSYYAKLLIQGFIFLLVVGYDSYLNNFRKADV